MIDNILIAILILASAFSLAYYAYLIGKVKGLYQAIDIVLKQREEDNDDNY